MLCPKFQSTHPRRVWLTLCVSLIGLLSFNPHTHEGCDTRCYIESRNRRCFNPHTHEGCDCIFAPIKHSNLCFNPHTHEGCDYDDIKKYIHRLSFNPHTHEGCDAQEHLCKVLEVVSIHTPTKGVTNFCFAFCHCFAVSIHTPTKGVTLDKSEDDKECMFQSTHPRRVWLSTKVFSLHPTWFQSTHPRRVWPPGTQRVMQPT